MIVTLYRAYMLYQFILATQGLYVALGYIRWIGGYTYEYLTWLLSYVYGYEVPRPPLQVADKIPEKVRLPEDVSSQGIHGHQLNSTPKRNVS